MKWPDDFIKLSAECGELYRSLDYTSPEQHCQDKQVLRCERWGEV